MTPQIDTTPISILVWTAFIFVVVLLFIAYVLNAGEKTEDFEPYLDGHWKDEDEKCEVSVTGEEDFIYEDSDKNQTEKDLEYFDLDKIGWLKRHSTPSFADYPDWKRAFRLYNRHHAPPLSMFCTPCYSKVLQYIIKLKNEKTNQEKNGNPGC